MENYKVRKRFHIMVPLKVRPDDEQNKIGTRQCSESNNASQKLVFNKLSLIWSLYVWRSLISFYYRQVYISCSFLTNTILLRRVVNSTVITIKWDFCNRCARSMSTSSQNGRPIRTQTCHNFRICFCTISCIRRVMIVHIYGRSLLTYRCS